MPHILQNSQRIWLQIKPMTLKLNQFMGEFEVLILFKENILKKKKNNQQQKTTTAQSFLFSMIELFPFIKGKQIYVIMLVNLL